MQCLKPVHLFRPNTSIFGVDSLNSVVPCGRCYECRKRTALEWAFRLEQHEKVSEWSYFTTLTYDDTYLPKSNYGIPEVNIVDVQNYFRLLRKKLPDEKITYMVACEYGGLTGRPHYHAIIMGSSKSRKAGIIPRQAIDDSWKLGFTATGPVYGGAIGYTMKYMTKARMDDDIDPEIRLPERRLMSKGIGASFLTPEIIKHYKKAPDRLFVVMRQNFKLGLPRYYGEKIFGKNMWPLIKAKANLKQKDADYYAFQKFIENEQNQFKDYEHERFKARIHYSKNKERDTRRGL